VEPTLRFSSKGRLLTLSPRVELDIILGYCFTALITVVKNFMIQPPDLNLKVSWWDSDIKNDFTWSNVIKHFSPILHI
jgi:hypothetical protein